MTEEESMYARWISCSRKLCSKILFVLPIICFLIVCVLVGLFFFHTNRDDQSTSENGSSTHDQRRKPSETPLMRVYIYNFTNADEFVEKSNIKPILDELGPYVYSESWEKVNLVQDPNRTESFNQKKIFRFNTTLSTGSENDMIMVPNITYRLLEDLALKDPAFNKCNFNKASFETNATWDYLFTTISVGDFLWGYNDPSTPLFEKRCTNDTHKKELPFKKYGIFFDRNGTSADHFSVHTCADGFHTLGKISRFNELEKLNYYQTDESNMFNGTDSTICPPNLTKDSEIFIFDENLCGRLPLTFQEEVSTHKAYRFSPKKDVFNGECKNPENNGSFHAPNGTFNISSCVFGNVPFLVSFPHFYMGNRDLKKSVIGMSPPHQQIDELYIDVEPQTGIPLTTEIRLQLNLLLTQYNSNAHPQLSYVILPLLWYEEEIKRAPNHTDSPANILFYSEIGMVLLLIFFVCGISFYIWRRIGDPLNICTSIHEEKDDSTVKPNLEMAEVCTD